MPISLTVCLTLLVTIWMLRRATGYRGMSVIFIFLLFNAISLGTTVIDRSFFKTIKFLWPMSPQLDWYNAGILVAVSGIGLLVMFVEPAKQRPANWQFGAAVKDQDVFWAFLLLFVVGCPLVLASAISTLRSSGLSLSGILTPGGAADFNKTAGDQQGGAGFFSVIFYASVLLVGPACLARKVSFPAILAALVAFMVIAFIKDLSYGKRGFTANTALLLSFSLFLWRPDLTRPLLISSLFGALFLVGFFLAIVLLRFQGGQSVAIQVAVENGLSKFYGQWVASSYIFDVYQGASPLPGLMTYFNDFGFAAPYQTKFFDYVSYYPVTAFGPWNSATAIGYSLEDFGLFGGALVFVMNFCIWVVIEVLYVKGGGLMIRLVYNAILPMVSMTIITFRLFADPRFMLAVGLAMATVYLVAISRKSAVLLRMGAGEIKV